LFVCLFVLSYRSSGKTEKKRIRSGGCIPGDDYTMDFQNTSLEHYQHT